MEDGDIHQPKHGWQHLTSKCTDTLFIPGRLVPSLYEAERAMLRSQGGPLAACPVAGQKKRTRTKKTETGQKKPTRGTKKTTLGQIKKPNSGQKSVCGLVVCVCVCVGVFVLLCVCLLCVSAVCVGPKFACSYGPRAPPPDRPSAGPPKISLFFFLLPPPFSFFFLSGDLLVEFFLSPGLFSCLFSSLWGLLVEFWWCFGRSGPQMCLFRPQVVRPTLRGPHLF